ncbi:hypothetical protein HD806DRAFT_80070 [Xylariaceae sp. AK1471]|nr:hypothetical protein HD806DRAFT_80070 [Xylariaceae sp. AK1471]
MSENIHHSGAMSGLSQEAGELSVGMHAQSQDSAEGEDTKAHRNATQDEWKEYATLFDKHVWPEICAKLKNGGTGVSMFPSRKTPRGSFLFIQTKEELPADIQEEVKELVKTGMAKHLGEDFRAKISVDFVVGEIRRSQTGEPISTTASNV